MFSLQVTLSDFRSRKRQFVPVDPLIVVLRFGSIKLDIKLNSNGCQLLGGKRIVLDITAEQLKNMFLNYALGMFIENQQGRFFSILSLEKLQFSDIVSGQQVYFYNDNEEIFYSANFSLIFNGFNNLRMPNKEKIQNHKTFDQFYKKPDVPSHQVPAKTLSSFLYGKKMQQTQKQVQNLSLTGGKVAKPKPSSVKKNPKLAATSVHNMQKTKKVPQFSVTSQPQIQIYNPYDENQQLDDENPPMMQFANTAVDPTKGINLLKTQMAELNLTAPESIKFMTAYQSKNAFSKTKSKDARNTIIKIQEKLDINQYPSMRQTKSFKENIDTVKVNRDELRNKAKQEMEAYQGNNNIKIPILKDGKYEFVELANLSEQEIANFAKRQKELEMEEEKKKMAQKQLQKKQKQNSLLKKQLQEKQRLLQKQEEQAKRQKLELLKAKQLAQENKKLALTNKIPSPPVQPSDSYDDDDDDDDENKQEEQASQKQSDEEKEEDDYYQSDFESMSMASAQKKSRISVNSQKKEQESYNDYNQSYDPDFESYSQSLLGSQQKLSMSEISESLKDFSSKRR